MFRKQKIITLKWNKLAYCVKRTSVNATLRLVHRLLQLLQRARPSLVTVKIWKLFYLTTVYPTSQQICSVVSTNLYSLQDRMCSNGFGLLRRRIVDLGGSNSRNSVFCRNEPSGRRGLGISSFSVRDRPIWRRDLGLSRGSRKFCRWKVCRGRWRRKNLN